MTILFSAAKSAVHRCLSVHGAVRERAAALITTHVTGIAIYLERNGMPY
jgi:hypothetical protein